ncbi:MAG: PilZ domain-containing protein [Nitrospirae bacterium]|nr:MAG: PilZ domain-containing protein [Nitrospirota bacterium]
MQKPPPTKETLSFEALSINNAIEFKALVDLLVEKGIINRQELTNKTAKLRAQTENSRKQLFNAFRQDKETAAESLRNFIAELHQTPRQNAPISDKPDANKRQSNRRQYEKRITCSVSGGTDESKMEVDIFDVSSKGMGIYTDRPLEQWSVLKFYDENILTNIGFVCNCTKIKNNLYRVGITFMPTAP